MTQEVITFGCRLNAYESEVIKSSLKDSGHDNVAVFNTCAVTKEAERQARQAIRKYHRENPDAKIIVTGCAAQINPKIYADMDVVDCVLGNEEKLKKDSYENLSFAPDTEKIQVNDIMSVKETAGHMLTSANEQFDGRARAFLQIQNGCNHRCTFCIIPYGRGNSRSVPIGEIASQMQQLVDSGFQEIVLTGVDITDYGLDLPGTPVLGQMIRRVLNLVPDLPRIRLSSVDVAEIDDELRDLIANEPRLMPHFHLSLQAGDNMILKRMKRRHTREQVLEFCDMVREHRPDASFGADIIAGFPTETVEMFGNTLNLVAEAGLTFLHVFPYSEREGTPAANIPESKQVPKQIRKERAKILRDAGEQQLHIFLENHIGKTISVLMETENLGRTENYCEVTLDTPLPIGEIINIKIVDICENKLVGEALGIKN